MITSDTCENCGDKNRHCDDCGANRLAKIWKNGECPECGLDLAIPGQESFPASPTSVALESKSGSKKVIVTDIQMPFESMVVFMVKWAFASIPAVIILGVVWMLLIGLVA